MNEFLDWVEGWKKNLPALDLQEYMTANHIEPHEAAVVSVDLIKGFCDIGPLSSTRIAAIVPAAVKAMECAHELGITDVLLLQDSHSVNATEFDQFGPHCIAGTEESNTIDEIRDSIVYDGAECFSKNSISEAVGPDSRLDHWVRLWREEIKLFIIVGDCTDLCVYQAVMYIKLTYNAYDIPVTVIVPENAVQTYDLDMPTATKLGAVPHPGDLLHNVFLYHMMLNGITIVKEVV